METEQILSTPEAAPPVTPPAVNDAPPADKTKVVEAAAPEAKAPDAPATTKEDKAPEPETEIKYDLKLSEGSPLTQDHIDEIVSFAKERGLSNEMAQEYLRREEGAILKNNQEQLTKFEALRTDWYNEINGDKELGGENLKQTAEYAQRALVAFAPESLQKFLKESPYGNHPDLIRTFYKIGKAMQNDTLVSANAHSAKSKSYEELLYDNTPKEN